MTKAFVFDAYGTLFDVHSAVGRYQDRLGAEADAVSAKWRSKQLEYTWLRSLMGEYKEFFALTRDALDYVMAFYGIDDDEAKELLMNAYLSLDCYPEVPDVLAGLKQQGHKLAILSNGSPDMLTAAVDSAGLGNLFDALLSVDVLAIFKPDMRVYQLACDALDVEPGEVMFQSSNAWDAVGAKCFGFNVNWINRFNQPAERLGYSPDNEIKTLEPLLSL